jgi:hypothetical protein
MNGTASIIEATSCTALIRDSSYTTDRVIDASGTVRVSWNPVSRASSPYTDDRFWGCSSSVNRSSCTSTMRSLNDTCTLDPTVICTCPNIAG